MTAKLLQCGRCPANATQTVIGGLLVDPPGWADVQVSGNPACTWRLCDRCAQRVRDFITNAGYLR